MFSEDQWLFEEEPFYPYEINQSLRFNDDDSAYLQWTPSSTTTDPRVFTISFWMKRGNLGTVQRIICAGNSNSITPFETHLSINELDQITFVWNGNGGGIGDFWSSDAVFRDPSAWYHVHIIGNVDNVTRADRVQLFVNGVPTTFTPTGNASNSSTSSFLNSSHVHRIANNSYSNGNFGDFYLSEFHLVQGISAGATDFGEFKENIWIPKEYTGSYGTNGFFLDYRDSGSIGTDYSDRGNNWTPVNLAASDVVLDSPTNNFAVTNNLFEFGADITYSEGNLYQSYIPGTLDQAGATIGVSSGKWYYEVIYTSGVSTSSFIGFRSLPSNGVFLYRNGTTLGITGTPSSGWSNNNVIGVALNLDDGEIEFFENNVSKGILTITDWPYADPLYPSYGNNAHELCLNFGQDSTFAGNTTAGGFTDANGIGDFKYQPPSGYLALCTSNLPEPVIGPNKQSVRTDIQYLDLLNNSLRFNDDDSPYLSRTPSSDGDRQTWTFTTWFKPANRGVNGRLFSADDGATSQDGLYIRHSSSGKITLAGEISNVNGPTLSTNEIFSDPKWYHLVVSFDSTQVTAADRIFIYVDGVERSLSVTNAVPPGDHMINNSAFEHRIASSAQTTQVYDGYLSETYFIDGTALTPESFGEFRYGKWIPKSPSSIVPSIDFGTNGFYLNYEDSSTVAALGTDSSGNGNTWTVNNLATADQMIDVPTDGYTTLNPDDVDIVTLTEGNLKGVITGSASDSRSFCGYPIIEDTDHYFEVYLNDGTFCSLGVIHNSFDATATTRAHDFTGGAVLYNVNGNKYINGSPTAYGATYTTGDIIGVAVSRSSGTVTFYKNGSSQGAISHTFVNGSYKIVLYYGNSTGSDTLTLNAGSDATFAGADTGSLGPYSDDNGYGEFYYQPPTGFLALNDWNTGANAIRIGSSQNADDNFNTVLYTGVSGANSITGVGFQPDLLWAKSRSGAFSHGLVDSVRGDGIALFPNDTIDEIDNIGTHPSLTGDGFDIPISSSIWNNSGSTYVAWNWKASNAAPVTNTDGSMTSTVSANTDAGFSIIQCNTTAANADCGHGLSKKPDLHISKQRNAVSEWYLLYNLVDGTDDYLRLNLTNAKVDYGFTYATNTTVTLPFGSGADVICYAFHSVEGYSKFGSYTGNGVDEDGPFVYLGFRPALIMVKRTDAASEWAIYDNKRDNDNAAILELLPNRNYTENSVTSNISDSIDLLSNGFKFRNFDGAAGNHNTSGGTYIYMAFAESPFKYSNAR